MNLPAANQTAATRLRLRITAAAETIVRSGHPWLFPTACLNQIASGNLEKSR